MRTQQTGLERQLDELRNFQKFVVGRELRMKELAAENAILRKQIDAAGWNGIMGGGAGEIQGELQTARRTIAKPQSGGERGSKAALIFGQIALDFGIANNRP